MRHFIFFHQPYSALRKARKISPARRQARMVVAQIEESMTRFLLDAFQSFRKELSPSIIARLLFEGNSKGIEQHIMEKFEPIMAGLDQEIMRGAALAGNQAIKELGPRFNRVGFDITREAAITWADERAATMITAISEETRESLNRLVTEGIRAERHPRSLAEDIRNRVGLTNRDQGAVTRRVKFWEDSGLSRGRISELKNEYTENLLARRAENIARTETMSAINNGRMTAWQQLKDDGYIDGTQRKQWIVSPDERLCPICRPMRNQEKKLEEKFKSPVSMAEVMAPPIHPQCRCTMILTRRKKR